jgi:hypothetical protein
MKNLALTLFFLTLHTVHQTHTNANCMGYTEKNPETGVGKGGNLRTIKCGCECRSFERTSDNRCINCLHRQAGLLISETSQAKPTLPTLAIKNQKDL